MKSRIEVAGADLQESRAKVYHHARAFPRGSDLKCKGHDEAAI